MEFVKAQGLGNDFIIIDCLSDVNIKTDWSDLAVRMCDRNFGIGGDGLILVLPSDTADYRMRIINSDGSEPEMCGNGIRCFARYLLDKGLARTPMTVDTLAGIKTIDIVFQGALGTGFRVNMGAPYLDAAEIPVTGYDGRVISKPLTVDGTVYDITCVSMGNPHCMIFTDDVDAIPLEQIGPKIETHPAFPRKTNVEFVQVLNENEIRVRVWERGAGITLACGTGACASVVASVLNGKISREPAVVHLPGGDLTIEWNESDDVFMTGPAQIVFTGVYQY
ncbi:MAG: diaminopimelate epimerase [Armatimonadota bacterium]